MSTFRVVSRVASRNLRVRSSRPQVHYGSKRPTDPANPSGAARRYNSTSPSGSGNTDASSISPSVIGGITGGAAVFFAGYTWYHFSGAKTVVKTAKQTEATLKKYTDQLKSSTSNIEPSEAINWLRSTAKSYAAIIPGASSYIDTAFDDIDAIRSKHGKEVDSIIKEAYNELKDISSKDGMTFASASKGWEVLQKHLQRIANLAGDAGQDLLNNHPALKAKIGGNLDQLKQMGERYGPDAKKQVEETINQISEILKNGMRVDSIPKIQSLIQDKTQKIQDLGSKLWDQGMEKASPLLEKSPQVKEMVKENTDTLKKSGNITDLYNQIKDAVSSGSTQDLKQYIDKVKQSTNSKSGGGSGLESYLKMIPGGSQIIPNLSKMQNLAQEHGQEAEKLAKETFKEIEEILTKKVKEAQELARDAEKDAQEGP